MHIVELFEKNKTVVSCEIFPPKPDASIETIFKTLEGLSQLKPDFISVTYGAGGSLCARTLEIASRVKNDFQVETLAHLTCVGASKAETDEVLEKLKQANIENVLALRGDLPEVIEEDSATEYHQYAKDLIAHIQEKHKFCIAAAAYPEGHIDCRDLKLDQERLTQKVRAGADFLVTQLFFDNQVFHRFLDSIYRLRIECPVVAGIMPVLNASQIKRITTLCGASVPEKLTKIMERFGGNPADMEKAGIEYACSQITDLVDKGADGIHLYTMNKAVQSAIILKNTGLRI